MLLTSLRHSFLFLAKPLISSSSSNTLTSRSYFLSYRSRLKHIQFTEVICHTTPERGDGYLWGWVARVTFDLPTEVQLELDLDREGR